MRNTPAPSTPKPSTSPLSLDAELYERIIKNINMLNPASSNFESEFNKVFTQAQKDLGIADEKIISGVASLILQQLPSNNIIADKFKFLELSIKDLENLIKFGMAISIEGQEGSFASDPHQLISRQINPETGKLVLYPNFIAPYNTLISKGLENDVHCQSADGISFLKSYIDSITTNPTPEIEKLADGKFFLPNILQLQKMIGALLDPNFRELFEARRFKDSNCSRPPFNDAGSMREGLVTPRVLNSNVEGRHIVGAGTNILYASPFSPFFNRVSSHEHFHSSFSGHVDENFPQLLSLLDLDSKDMPISIMKKKLTMDQWLDNRFGVLDYFLAAIAKNQAYKKGGVQEFEKYKNCTEELKDLVELLKQYNCSLTTPIASDPTSNQALTSTLDPASTLAPTSTPIPTSTPKSKESEGGVSGNLSDKIATQAKIESSAIFLGFLTKLILIKASQLNEEERDMASSWVENISRIIAIGVAYGSDAAFQSLALPALVSSYKTLEVSAEEMGFTRPSEALKKMTEGAIGSEARERIAEIYKNTPEYAKLMATQFAFVSAIHFLGNLIEDDRENKLTYSQSLMLSSTTALFSAVLRAGFHYLEKKIGNYFQDPVLGAETPPASQNADSTMEQGVRPAVNGDLVMTSHRDSRENGDSVRVAEISLAPQNLNLRVAGASPNQSQLVEVASGIFAPEGLFRDNGQIELGSQPAEGVDQQISSVQARTLEEINIAELSSSAIFNTIAILGGFINLSQSFQAQGQNQSPAEVQGRSQSQTPAPAPEVSGGGRLNPSIFFRV